MYIHRVGKYLEYIYVFINTLIFMYLNTVLKYLLYLNTIQIRYIVKCNYSYCVVKGLPVTHQLQSCTQDKY